MKEICPYCRKEKSELMNDYKGCFSCKISWFKGEIIIKKETGWDVLRGYLMVLR